MCKELSCFMTSTTKIRTKEFPSKYHVVYCQTSILTQPVYYRQTVYCQFNQRVYLVLATLSALPQFVGKLFCFSVVAVVVTRFGHLCAYRLFQTYYIVYLVYDLQYIECCYSVYWHMGFPNTIYIRQTTFYAQLTLYANK